MPPFGNGNLIRHNIANGYAALIRSANAVSEKLQKPSFSGVDISRPSCGETHMESVNAANREYFSHLIKEFLKASYWACIDLFARVNNQMEKFDN